MKRRATGWLLLTLIPLFLVSYGYYEAKRAEPAYTGTRVLPGLQAPVTVTFGPHAVPHLRAQSQEDLFFAQGYIVASERMWQMDLIRRLARGRLAEVFGEKALPADRLYRTLGLERAAKRSVAALNDETRRYLQAYALGVNAYRDSSRNCLPLEYRIARFEPAAWHPVDSLAIGEYMAFLLSANFTEELAYLRLAHRLGKERALELFPTDEGVPAPPYARDLPDYWQAGQRLDPYPRVAQRWGLPEPGPGSNSWAITGTRTQSGLPLLANDPHLSPTVPGTWYELEMQAPGYHAAGTCLPGAPFIVIGHNEDLAWGLTSSMADTQDIFVERLAPDSQGVERSGGRSERIRGRIEIIAVRGWTKPQRLRIRETANGVILNDVLGGPTGTIKAIVDVDTAQLLALRWNLELPDRGAEGLYHLNKAATIEQARAALTRFVHVSQNVLIAHRNGTIAWQMTGALPIRRKGLGTFPSPGWTGEYGWTGYLAPKRNPGIDHPLTNMLITANNRTIPLNYPVHVTRSWQPPYRALRIRERLNAHSALSTTAFARIQLDRGSIEARRWIAALRAIAPQLHSVDQRAASLAQRYLFPWDASFEPGSTSAALFVLLRAALNEQLFGDELQDDLPILTGTYLNAYNALQEAIRSGQSSFWDDVRTPVRETPAQIWGRAIQQAWAALELYPGNTQPARLEQLRPLIFPHAFHSLPVLGRLFDIGPIGIGGDNLTINVAKSDITSPERIAAIPSYRYVFTPGAWQETRGTHTLGQSGHRFSAYRTDQLQDWLAGRWHPWHWNGPPKDQLIGTLVLLPSG